MSQCLSVLSSCTDGVHSTGVSVRLLWMLSGAPSLKTLDIGIDLNQFTCEELSCADIQQGPQLLGFNPYCSDFQPA